MSEGVTASRSVLEAVQHIEQLLWSTVLSFTFISMIIYIFFLGFYLCNLISQCSILYINFLSLIYIYHSVFAIDILYSVYRAAIVVNFTLIYVFIFDLFISSLEFDILYPSYRATIVLSVP